MIANQMLADAKAHRDKLENALKVIGERETAITEKSRAELKAALAGLEKERATIGADLDDLDKIEDYLMGLLVAIKPSTPPVPSGTFVAPTGNDTTGDGSFGAPYATVAKARDEIRLANNVSPIFPLGGNYHVTAPITFTDADDGLTIQKYLSEEPIFYGGDPITGLTDGGDTWTKTTDEVFGLLLNGVEQPRSALPVYDPADPYEGGWFTMDTGSTGTDIVYETGDIENGLTDLTHLKAYYYDQFQFWAGMADVTAIDHLTRKITINPVKAGTVGAIEPGLRFRLLDVKPQGTAKVLQPGEWWHSGTVLTYREVDSGFDGTGLVGAQTKHLFDNWTAGTPATSLTFDGLTIRGTAVWDNHADIGAWKDNSTGDGSGYRHAIISKGATTTVQNCKFEYCGGGIGLSNSANSSIYNNEFKFFGHSAITLTTDTNDLSIDNNLFEDGPTVYRAFQTVQESAEAVSPFSASIDVTVTHNAFNRIGGRCVSWGSATEDRHFAGGWLVQYNKFIDVCQEVTDSGPIYVINRYFEDPTLTTAIKDNWIENPLGRRTDSAGAWVRWSGSLGPHIYGIYLDDGTSLATVTGNIVIGKSTESGCWAGVHIHGGFENSITHNIFLNCRIDFSDRGQAASWAGSDTNTFDGNIISRRLAGDAGGSPVDGRFIQVSENPALHSIWESDNNAWYGTDTVGSNFWYAYPTSDTLAAWLSAGTPHDENSTTVDPLFTDATNDDYTLQAGTVKTNFGADLAFASMGRV